MPATTHHLLSFALSLLGATAALADARTDDLARRVKDELAKFPAARQRVSDDFRRDLAATIGKWRGGRGDAPARAKIVLRLESAAEQFAKTGEVPRDDELLPAVVRYADSLHKATLPVRNAHKAHCDAALRAGDSDVIQQATRSKEDFERSLGLRDAFEAGKHWNGTRANGTSNDEIRLEVNAFDGTTFEGKLHLSRNIAGHPVLKVKGKLDGLKVDWLTVGVLSGKARQINGAGYLIGPMIVGQISGFATNGGPATGYFVLRR